MLVLSSVALGLGACAGAPAGGSGASGTGEAGPAYHSLPTDPKVLRAQLAFSDVEVFDCEVVDGVAEITLSGPASYEPAVRSPRALALWASAAFGDFVLDVEAQQDGREYAHRDLCFFFGHQGPESFYYVHLASAADPNAHNVFVVDEAPRRNIATTVTEGVDWGAPDSWHHVRIAREGSRIRVWFDDMDTPVMEADDATFGVGRIGVGSFDDSGRFRNLRVTGEKVGPPAGAIFHVGG